MKVTINEASRELGISARTLDRWARLGRVKYERTTTGWRMFESAEIARVKALMAAKRRGTAGI